MCCEGSAATSRRTYEPTRPVAPARDRQEPGRPWRRPARGLSFGFSEATYWQEQELENLILGIYFGIAAIMALYNVFLFFSVRDSTYLAYVAYVASLGAYQLTFGGIFSRYVLPDQPVIVNQLTMAFLGLAIACVLLFTLRFLRFSTRPRLLRALLAVLAGVGVLIGLHGMFVSYRQAAMFGSAFLLLGSPVLFAAASLALWQGFRPARYYLFAFAALLVFAALFALRLLGILPASFLTEHGMKIGSAIEVMLLSLALGDRINETNRERVREQHEALERQAALTKSYARFVPHAFLDQLKKEDITEVVLGDAVEREMTVLFSDIRSYTTLSEKMSPADNLRFLNAIMGRVGPLVRNQRGFVDKYIGDAIMALFPEEPEDAVRAAIAMRALLHDYNERRRNQGFDPIITGFGINTGRMILGTIGETERLEATVISDAVNLASRIEGLTKLYGATILLSEQTLFRIPDPSRYHFRILDRVKVKGKQEPVSVFEILDGGGKEEIARRIGTLADFERGLQSYQLGHFSEGAAYFKAVLAVDNSDGAASLYLRRCDHFARHGVPPGWEGVEVLENK